MITPPVDSANVENAILAALINDAPLQALAPDGVWWDSAGEVNGKPRTRYVIVSLIAHMDVAVFGGRGYEDYLLLIKAVMLNAASVDIGAAAHRFDALLDDPDPLLDVPGFVPMAMFREQRIRFTEHDAENPAIRWLHWGGHYRVQVAIPT